MINPNNQVFCSLQQVSKDIIYRYRQTGDEQSFVAHVKLNIFKQLGIELSNKFPIEINETEGFITEFKIELCVFTREQFKELMEQEYLRGRKDTQVSIAKSLIDIQRESLL